MNIAREFLLSDDHDDVDALLNEAIDKLRIGSAADAFNALDLFWARLAMHIRAEHLHLFPAALKLSEDEAVDSGAEVPEIIERLRLDHDYFMHELAELIKAMRLITQANQHEIMRLATDRLQMIKSRLADHNAVEEDRIYPLYELLSASDREQLFRSIAKELSNLPQRFAKGN